MPVTLEFVSSLPDPDAFETLMQEYYAIMASKLTGVGGPQLSAVDLARDTMEHIEDLLPPHGRTLLTHDNTDRLMGCGVLRKVRPDAAELKRMFERPEAQGLGLGRKLFEMRIDAAKEMGCTTLYATP